MKKLSHSVRKWLAKRAHHEKRRLSKRPNRTVAQHRRNVKYTRVQLWQGGEPEWATCRGGATRPPKRLCLLTNTQRSFEFISKIQSYSRRRPSKKLNFVTRTRRGAATIEQYYDFSFPTEISTSIAVILAAEYELVALRNGDVPPTVNLHQWDYDVFLKLFQLGFFDIIGITNRAETLIKGTNDSLTMKIISTKNANDLAEIDTSLQVLLEFLNVEQDLPERIIIDVLTGLSEAISNVTNHAYPEGEHGHADNEKKLWISATANRTENSLTVVVYDQGVTIPFTYPRMQLFSAVLDYLGRALLQKTNFEFQNDGTYIRAAMEYGGSRTDLNYRGKGLPQMFDILKSVGKGRMIVYSRGGWCMLDTENNVKQSAYNHSIGGTLIEWTLELPRSESVD